MPLDWMRSVEKIPSIPEIKTGLVRMCEYLFDMMVKEAFGGGSPPIAIGMKCGSMYELGSFAGESAEVFARYFYVVHCVDPWGDACGAPSAEEVERSFDERAARAGNVVKHKMMGSELFESVPDLSADFVYVDAGAHTRDECFRDIAQWWPKVRRGGFLGGHDWEIPELGAADVFPGVERAVRDFFGGKPEDYGLRIFPDTSWLVRKP